MSTTRAHPLIFTLTNEIIVPERFSARIRTKGRILMTCEDGAWWCHGVEPGGMTACGDTPELAFHAFKQEYQGILEDLAIDSKDCRAFEAVARAFMAVDPIEAEAWEQVRAKVREGMAVESPFNSLPKDTSEFTASLKVTDLSLASQSEEQLAQAA